MAWGAAGKTYMELTTSNQLPAELEPQTATAAPAAVVTEPVRATPELAAVRAPFYIPSLDGIRALAVGIVFFAHAGYDHIIPGGMGVTIFFFLSGYLITTLLRREQEKKGKISLRKFYMRRVLRIWPPMYLALAFALILCFAGIVNVPRIEPVPLLFQSLHLTNIYVLFIGDGKIMPGTGVLWSLCVEEHFYLFFPLLLIILSKFFKRVSIAMILGAICVAVLGWRMFLYHQSGDVFRIFSGTDTRVDSILFGCIMGLWKNPYLDGARIKSLGLKLALLAGGLALLLFTLLYRNDNFRSTFRYTVQGIALFPIFFLAVSEARWTVFRWLELAPMRAIGKISYTLYLVHFPIVIATYETFPEFKAPAVVAIAAVASLIMATLVYYAVEKPLAHFRHLLA